TEGGGAVAPAGDEEDERKHAVDAASAPAPHAVQILFDALPGMTLLLSPLRSAAGAVEDFRIDAATPQA
ncbi:hypothetical protein, partial [Streptomyces sp. SID10815]|uniref:hypothetical protein n=1 Tax=Streptomyces sp. SID10815 TaxID=2706027 RepID=UPI0013CC91FE